MDTRLDSLPHDDGDNTAAFRKPSSDGSSRKYRRRALAEDGSSSSDGSPERNQSPNSKQHRGDSRKVADLSHARKDDRRDSDRGRYGRGGDSHRHERHSKRDDYSRHEKDADEIGRKHRMSPRSSRDSRSGHHSDRSRSRNDSDRHSRGKYGISEHKRIFNEKGEDLSSDRAVSGKRHTGSRSDDKEKDYVRSRDGLDEKRDPRRSFSDRHSRDERREHEDPEMNKEKDVHIKSPRDRSDGKCLVTEERDTHSKKLKGFTSAKFTHAEEKQTSSLKPAIGVGNQGLTLQAHSKETGISGDVDAAKVAAMQAAELVNKNLVGTGYLTTDQKKRLLWGKKKSTAAEESAHRWDSALVGDRERQEKFNKLMSLRLRWYIWGIVGCEREYRKPRGKQHKQARSPSREAERVADGSREAVHCRTEEKRWKNSGVRSLNLFGKLSTTSYSCSCFQVSGECCGIISLLYFTYYKLLVMLSSMRVRSKSYFTMFLEHTSLKWSVRLKNWFKMESRIGLV